MAQLEGSRSLGLIRKVGKVGVNRQNSKQPCYGAWSYHPISSLIYICTAYSAITVKYVNTCHATQPFGRYTPEIGRHYLDRYRDRVWERRVWGGPV